MIKNLCRVCVLSCVFFCVPSSWAVLDLELTQGRVAATPIAIEDFQADAKSTQIAASLETIVKQDCQNSGEFRVYLSETKQPVLHWQQVGATALVRGQVNALAFGKYRVSLQVYGLYEQPGHPLTGLLSSEFVTKAAGMRRLGHHLSDLIYEKLTGIPGDFSTKIAYVGVTPSRHGKRYRLMVADQDGYKPQTVLSSNAPLMSPAWSPDNTSLAYVSFEGHHAHIYTQDLKTGKRHLISAAPGINGAPIFSPDGRSLIFVLSKTGQPGLYRYDRLTHVVQAVTKGWAINTEPDWSPDGARVAFTSNRDGSPQIYDVDLSNGLVTRLSFDGSYNARARWLPDGKGFVFMHRDKDGFSIARQDLVTGSVQLLTDPGVNESPSVSPNGRMVVYTTRQGGHDTLARVSSDGRVHSILHQTTGDIREPVWSHASNN